MPVPSPINSSLPFTPDLPLDGLWDFQFLGKIDPANWQPKSFVPGEKMLVPSAFDATPAYAGQRGSAVYGTLFTVSPGYRARLTFGAVSLWSRIFVDGAALFENACGYEPFTVDLPASAHAERSLIVLVDNRFDFERAPMHEEYFDFYQYGGILRGILLRILPPAGPYIDHVHVTPGEGYRDGGVKIAIGLDGAHPAPVTLHFQFDGGAVQSSVIEYSGGDAVVEALVPNPRLWSPEDPQLHTLRIGVGQGDPQSAREIRFGLRRIGARDGAIWLNDKKILLRGYNRHEWHPNFGPCTPPLQMMADLQILRDIGCNFIRGAHYPQDQRFLDLCDELGFLVWEENLGWGQRERTFASETFRRHHLTALRNMVRASYNHPSVIIWGFLNEAGTNEDYVRPIMEETVATLRSLDPSRPISYATMFALEDRHYDLVDIISLNIYPGWYNCEGVENPLDLVPLYLRQCLEHIDNSGFRDKPVIISEIGAEAIYGWHDSHNDFFTEEHQAEYLRRAGEEALHHPRCSGLAIWHFSDMRTYGAGRSLKRPRTFNNKGTLDEYRRPKAAYKTVRGVFHESASLGVDLP